MNTNKSLTWFFLAVLLVLVGIVQPARASASSGLVTVNFIGTITSVSGPLPCLLTPTIGQQVNGSITYDTSQPPAFDTGSVAGYNQSPPSGMSVVISGVTIQSLGSSSFQVINNFLGFDNFNGAFATACGTSMFFNLTDFTQTALSSTALPPSLDLTKFSSRVGTIDITGGSTWTFSFDLPPPVANADVYGDAENTTLSIAAPGVLANDTPSTGTSAHLVSGPAHGTLTLNSDGSFSYAPGKNFVGTDSFTYSAQVGSLVSAPATATIYVVGTGFTCAGCDLSGLNLSGFSFANAMLTGANLSNTNLRGANLSNATLSSVNLTGADLTGANLSQANLANANLTNANLTNANLSQANLKGAILNGATLTGVIWFQTTCPDGTNSKNDGGTCLGHL